MQRNGVWCILKNQHFFKEILSEVRGRYFGPQGPIFDSGVVLGVFSGYCKGFCNISILNASPGRIPAGAEIVIDQLLMRYENSKFRLTCVSWADSVFMDRKYIPRAFIYTLGQLRTTKSGDSRGTINWPGEIGARIDRFCASKSHLSAFP